MDGVYLTRMYRLLYPGTRSEIRYNRGPRETYLPIKPKSTAVGTLICQYVQVLVIYANLHPPDSVQRVP